MKILVIGGMHGNEPLGIELVELLTKDAIKGVDTLIANKPAVNANCRFIGQDLNRSFPGDDRSSSYEPKRAAQILKQTTRYDVVLDFHNTYCSENDCGFIGEKASSKLREIAWLLGLQKIIVADYNCINKFATNCLSVEISLDSLLNNVELWYDRLRMLSKLDDISTTPNIEAYRFVYRMTLDDKKRLQLDKQNLTAFRPMNAKLASAMGVKSPAYPIFIGDNFTPYNYGGVLNKIEP